MLPPRVIKNGGTRVGKPAAAMVTGPVARAFGSLQPVNCSSEFCHVISVCRLKTALDQAVQCFLRQLDRYTLADLVENNHPR